jgi:hypothetical protein
VLLCSSTAGIDVGQDPCKQCVGRGRALRHFPRIHAEEFKSISLACKCAGISRSCSSETKEAFEKFGPEDLIPGAMAQSQDAESDSTRNGTADS